MKVRFGFEPPQRFNRQLLTKPLDDQRLIRVLAAGGQPSYVSEVEADGAMHYRVRVGSYTTREAAREAATRLATERQLATYVTTR